MAQQVGLVTETQATLGTGQWLLLLVDHFMDHQLRSLVETFPTLGTWILLLLYVTLSVRHEICFLGKMLTALKAGKRFNLFFTPI